MIRRSRTIRAAAFAAIAAAAVLPGCQSRKPKPKADPLPTLRQIDSEVTPPRQRPVPPDIATSRVLATVQRLEFPLEASLEDGWLLVDENVLPPVSREVWHNNGLRVGLIDRAAVAMLLRTLPRPLNARASRMFGSERPVPLRQSPQLRAPTLVDLTIPPDSAPKQQSLRGGRMKLQTRMMPDKAGRVAIDLIPHHFVPRLTVQPRTPLEKALDGRLFNELSIRLNVPEDKLVVLGLYYKPPTEPAESSPDQDPPPAATQPATPDVAQTTLPTSEQPDTEAAQEQETAHENPASAVPPTLGRALFAARRVKQPIQLLYLVALQPADSNADSGGQVIHLQTW